MQEEHITNEIVEWSGDEWGDKGGGATSESSLIEIVFQLRYLGPRAPSLTVVRGCPAPKRFVWKFFERGPFVSLVFSTRLVIPRQYCHEIATGIGANSTSSECRAEHAEITPMPTKGSRAGVFDCMCSDTVLNLIGICRKNIPMMTQIGFFYSFRFWFVEIPKISMLIMVRMLVKGAWNRHKTCMYGPVKPCVEPLGLLNPNSKHGKSKCKHDIPSTVFQKFWQCKGMGDMGTFASSNRADDEWLEAELWAAGMKRVAFNATSQHNLLSTFAHIALSQLLKSLDSQPYTVRLPCHPLQSPFCCYGDSMISIYSYCTWYMVCWYCIAQHFSRGLARNKPVWKIKVVPQDSTGAQYDHHSYSKQVASSNNHCQFYPCSYRYQAALDCCSQWVAWPFAIQTVDRWASEFWQWFYGDLLIQGWVFSQKYTNT